MRGWKAALVASGCGMKCVHSTINTGCKVKWLALTNEVARAYYRVCGADTQWKATHCAAQAPESLLKLIIKYANANLLII